MTEPIRASDVLHDILNVLQRIESKLEGHEDRLKSLEDHRISNNERETEGARSNGDTSSETITATETFRASAETLRPSRKATPTSNDSSGEASIALKIHYSQWSINQLDRFFSASLSKLLESRLGDCWNLPDDSRLPLKFFKSNVLQSNSFLGIPVDSSPTIKQPFQRDLEYLCQFDKDLRAHPGNDFIVVDFDAVDNTRLYRLGEEAFGPELQVEAQCSKSAPWSRLM